MGRPRRIDAAGYAYHVLNRANGRMRMFHTDQDYEAFERIIEEAIERISLRICAYILMPNHWHFVVWPEHEGQLTEFFTWLTMTHARRWHRHRGSRGSGHVYQDRFKSFPVDHDLHFLCVCRYAETNALRAKLVERAERWRWSSLWRRTFGSEAQRVLLSAWPVEIPAHWLELVNQAQDRKQIDAVRYCIKRGRPLGAPMWIQSTAKALGLTSALRSQGRSPREIIVPGTITR